LLIERVIRRNWVILYSLLVNMALPSNISCDWSISLKRSQSECQLTPVWLYCCALQNISNQNSW